MISRFSSNPAGNLAAFVGQENPPASDRLEVDPDPADYSLGDLAEREAEVEDLIEPNSSLRSVVGELWIDYEANLVQVGTIDPVQASQLLQEGLGNNNGVGVVAQSDLPSYSAGRNRATGRMLAGDRIVLKSDLACTAGFGAFEKRTEKSSDEEIIAPFVLTAGHRFARDQHVWRTPYAGFGGKDDWSYLGQVTRSPFEYGAGTIDVEAIRLDGAGLAPRHIYGSGGRRPSVKSPVVAYPGQRLCLSGAYSNRVECGNVVGIRKIQVPGDCCLVGVVIIDAPNIPGDSGGPVWAARSKAAVGIIKGSRGPKFTILQPLLDTPNGRGDTYRGALNAAQMFDLKIMKGG